MNVNAIVLPRTERLPQELADLVIDHIELDVDLHHATLVCRAWLPRSSLHLLRIVSVNYFCRPDWWAGPIGGAVARHACTHFLDTLARSARLQHHVREVVVIHAATCAPPVLARIVRSVPRLERVLLRGEFDVTVPVGLRRVCFGGTLHLHRCHAAALVHALRAFDGLRHLCLSPAVSYQNQPPELKLDLWALRIEEITLEYIDTYTLRVLEAYLDPSSTLKFSLYRNSPENYDNSRNLAVAVLEQSLPKFGRSLKSLTVDSRYFRLASCNFSALKHLHRLQHLTLVITPSDKCASDLPYIFGQRDITESIRKLSFVTTPSTFQSIVGDPEFNLSTVVQYLEQNRAVQSVTWTLITRPNTTTERAAFIPQVRQRLQLVLPDHLRDCILVASRESWR